MRIDYQLQEFDFTKGLVFFTNNADSSSEIDMISLIFPDGRILDICHIKKNIKQGMDRYSWELNCSDEEFEAGKYSDINGLIGQKVSTCFDFKTYRSMLEWAFSFPSQNVAKAKVRYLLPYYETFRQIYEVGPDAGVQSVEDAKEYLLNQIRKGKETEPLECMDSGFLEKDIKKIFVCPRCGTDLLKEGNYVCKNCGWEM